MYQMFPQFMSQPMSAQNVVQPPPRVCTQRLPEINRPRHVEYQLLEEQICVIKGFSSIGLNARELCLMPNVVLPQKLKVLDLLKCKGLSCPCQHITMYCRKMDSYIDNDELLIHFFRDILFGALWIGI